MKEQLGFRRDSLEGFMLNEELRDPEESELLGFGAVDIVKHSYHHLPAGELISPKRLLPEIILIRLAVRTRCKQAFPVPELRMVVAAPLAFRSRLIAVRRHLAFHEIPVEIQASVLTH